MLIWRNLFHQTISFIKLHVIHATVLFLYSCLEYYLGRTKRFVANSVWEIIFGLFKKGDKAKMFSKELQLGQVGSLAVSEAAGVATVKVSVNAAVGGGQAAGVLKAAASVEVDVEAAQLVQLALDLLKSKLPAGVQSLVTDLEAVAIPALKSV